MAEKFKGSLVGRTFVVKQAREHGLARTPWAVYERHVNMDWKMLDFLTATEAARLVGLLERMGGTVIKEERG